MRLTEANSYAALSPQRAKIAHQGPGLLNDTKKMIGGMATGKFGSTMSEVLDRWNTLEGKTAARVILRCCGSAMWANVLSAQRPFATAEDLLLASDAVWRDLPEDSWREAFDSHPRIGESRPAGTSSAQSIAWSSQEQSSAVQAQADITTRLAEANRRYEERFGRIFIVCASGRSAEEILAIANARMGNDNGTEMLEAAEQQRQITQLRLRRWLGQLS